MGSLTLSAVQVLSDALYEFGRMEMLQSGAAEVRLQPVTWEQLDDVQLPRAETLSFSSADLLALRGALDAKFFVGLRDSVGARIRIGSTVRGVTVIGLEQDSGGYGHDSIGAGRLPYLGGRSDSVSSDAFISERVARLITREGAPVESAIGTIFEVNGVPLRIVGVGMRASRPRTLSIWVSRKTARSIAPSAHEALVARPMYAPSQEAFDEMIAKVSAWVDTERRSWRRAVWLSSKGLSQLETMRRRVRLIRLGLGAFCSLTILVAAIGIANVIFASVLERIREVGIRKAVGARFGDVFLQFLAESLAIAVVGTALGIAAGMGVATAIAAFLGQQAGKPLDVELRSSTVAFTASVALVAGTLAGVAPAIRAARIAPSDAMRTE